MQKVKFTQYFRKQFMLYLLNATVDLLVNQKSWCQVRFGKTVSSCRVLHQAYFSISFVLLQKLITLFRTGMWMMMLFWVLGLHLQPWRWKHFVSPKRGHLPTSLHGAKTQKHIIIILTAVKTSSHRYVDGNGSIYSTATLEMGRIYSFRPAQS
jgi:hypothetical protein